MYDGFEAVPLRARKRCQHKVCHKPDTDIFAEWLFIRAKIVNLQDVKTDYL